MPEKKEYHTPSNGLFFQVQKLLSSEASTYQQIEVIENEAFGRILILDGLVQTTEKDEFFYHEMLVHPAFVSHPSPDQVLIIGGGDGGALKEVLRYPVQGVSLVEIDSRVIEASYRYFPWLSEALKDKRSKLVIADGQDFIEHTTLGFDVVLIDSSDPVGPSQVLHEKEFYEHLKKRLNPSGIIAAQAGSPLYHLESIRFKVSFLKELFKVAEVYTGPVPTYPGGNWCYVFLSDEVAPSSVRREQPANLKYFNLDIHRAAFALPNFVKNALNKE